MEKVTGELQRLQRELQEAREEIQRLFQMYEDLNNEPATDKQGNLIKSLCRELGLPEPELNGLRRPEASIIISFLLGVKRRRKKRGDSHG